MKSSSGGRRSGEKQKCRIPSRRNDLASVPAANMYGSRRAPGSRAPIAAAIASISDPSNVVSTGDTVSHSRSMPGAEYLGEFLLERLLPAR